MPAHAAAPPRSSSSSSSFRSNSAGLSYQRAQAWASDRSSASCWRVVASVVCSTRLDSRSPPAICAVRSWATAPASNAAPLSPCQTIPPAPVGLFDKVAVVVLPSDLRVSMAIACSCPPIVASRLLSICAAAWASCEAT